MALQQRSHRVTAAYRTRLKAIQARVEQAAKRIWPDIENLDGTNWPELTAQIVAQAQRDGVRLTAAYLTAYLRSETGHGTVPPIDSRPYVGKTPDGRDLAIALGTAVVGAKAQLSAGVPYSNALAYGLNRGIRMATFAATQMPRDALLAGIASSSFFAGFQRSTLGACGACLALSGHGGPKFPVHPNCDCVPEPLVAGVENRFPVPSGSELFDSKTPAEQDAAVGTDAAKAIRSGEASVSDLVAHSDQALQPDFITQAPEEALHGDN